MKFSGGGGLSWPSAGTDRMNWLRNLKTEITYGAMQEKELSRRLALTFLSVRLLSRKNTATLILKTGRFDDIDSAVIISSVDKAVQNKTESFMMTANSMLSKPSSFRSYCGFSLFFPSSKPIILKLGTTVSLGSAKRFQEDPKENTDFS